MHHSSTKPFALIPKAQFELGSDRHYPEERPKRIANVDAFEISPTAVSNIQFKNFVDQTGYVTTAEVDLPDDGNTPKEALVAGSLVFQMSAGPVNLRDFRNWWAFVAGACWHAPEGPHSNLEGRWDHPVVHISWFDAKAYADWAGLELPTEKEWEHAASGGVNTVFPWGDTLHEDEKIHANTWVGNFPYQNDTHGRGPFTMPVDSFEPNGFGLYNMIGNVWEWTSSPYDKTQSSSCCTPARNLVEGDVLTLKGGSHLCAPSYCQRYRKTARSPQETRSSTSHIGFRCVKRS